MLNHARVSCVSFFVGVKCYRMDAWTDLVESVRLSWSSGGRPSRVTAAVSGGADSVALLLALAELEKELGFSLSAAHVNHGLRPDAGKDAAFTEALCREKGVPCRILRVSVDGKSEDAARRARYEALMEACRFFGSAALALAHHRRDQMETVLLHLFRGSGGGGLAAMEEWSVRSFPEGGELVFWRPFLAVSPDAIRSALRKKGISWTEDETNGRDDYLRNFLRHQVLPAVSSRVPQAEVAVSRAARILSEENRYFTAAAKAFLAKDGNAQLDGPCRWVRREALEEMHPALLRHVLRAACPVPLDWDTTERLSGLSPGEKMNLPLEWRAECSREYLHFLPPKKEEAPPAPGRLVARPWQGETGDGKRTQALRRTVFDSCELRFRQPGDVIRPLGAKGSKSLQDYFVDKKIPRPFRQYVPLLCRSNRVIWAIGVGPGEEARVGPGDDAVLIAYEGFLPGRAPDEP